MPALPGEPLGVVGVGEDREALVGDRVTHHRAHLVGRTAESTISGGSTTTRP
jgi:hypothetical protein